MNMLNRVVGDSFSPNVYITFNPHQCNCSSMWLLFNFKQALGRFYQNVLKHKRFYKHKDQQYPLIVFLENGKNRDIGENNPHLHVLVQLPIDKKKAFVDAIYDMLIKIFIIFYCNSLPCKTLKGSDRNRLNLFF